jgi:hypothetical protein
MQVCWNCGAKQLDGTVFCSDCGAGLLGVQTDRETTASLSQPVDSSDHAVQPMVVPAPDDGALQGATFRLVVLNSGQAVELDITNDVLVGREDKSRSVRPDLDLGLYGGYDEGVSRRHARILQRDDDYLLEDLGSANGTFVNGKLLSPRQPTVIKNGDEIAFGTLLLRVEL